MSDRSAKKDADRLHKLDPVKEHKKKVIEEGERLVKTEKREEWRKFVENNMKKGRSPLDFYSAAIVEASLKIMSALSNGASPEEAAATVNNMGISLLQMTYAVLAVVHFHPRGEEFRNYWNSKWVSKEEAQHNIKEGVVNPAIFTISS